MLILVALISLLIILFLVNLLWPFFDPPRLEELLATSSAARQALLEARGAELPFASVELSPFVQALIPTLRTGSYKVRLQWDNIVLSIGGLLIGILVISQLALSITPPQRSSGPQPRLRKGRSTPEAPSHTVSFDEPPPQSAEYTLATDVDRAITLASSLYSRSTLLLGGGIVMSFIGIGVFWVSLPSMPADGKYSVTAYLPLTIRPLGMLVFVEAIAWFLLRQYRALVEDYKAFHRMYLRRINFLIALRLVSESGSSPSKTSIAAALLVDDVSGRLKKDETTEALEGTKQIEPNPVVELFSAAIKRASEAKRPAANPKGE
jgi:hypothetical protein